jgi:hypothetical protein
MIERNLSDAYVHPIPCGVCHLESRQAGKTLCSHLHSCNSRRLGTSWLLLLRSHATVTADTSDPRRSALLVMGLSFLFSDVRDPPKSATSTGHDLFLPAQTAPTVDREVHVCDEPASQNSVL